MLAKFIKIKTNKAGEKGLYALSEIEKGEVVWRLNKNEKKLTKRQRESLPPEIQKLAFQYKDKYIVVHDGSEFMNHSCDPNLWWGDDETLIARRDIKSGEELTYDYSTADVGDWEADWECKCGSDICRRRISGNDCLDKEFQERYGMHLPSWTLYFIEHNGL